MQEQKRNELTQCRQHAALDEMSVFAAHVADDPELLNMTSFCFEEKTIAHAHLNVRKRKKGRKPRNANLNTVLLE